MPAGEIRYQSSRFAVERRRYQDAEGHWHERDFVIHPGAVAILPLVDDERLCLIRNVRHALGETLLEIPAGTLEVGEDPLEAARRELAEETGYRAGAIRLLTEFHTSPGVLSERMYLYLATQLMPGDQQLDTGEEIDTLLVPWTEALELAQSGQLRDAKTMLAIYMLAEMRRRGEI